MMTAVSCSSPRLTVGWAAVRTRRHRGLRLAAGRQGRPGQAEGAGCEQRSAGENPRVRRHVCQLLTSSIRCRSRRHLMVLAALPTRRHESLLTAPDSLSITRIDQVGVSLVLPSTGSALLRGRVHSGRPGAPVGTKSAFRARDLQRGQLDAEGAAGQINFAGGDHHTGCTGADGLDDASHLLGGADRQNPSTAGG